MAQIEQSGQYSRDGVFDARLSWRARGLLVYARTHSEPMTVENVLKATGGSRKFGKESAASALNELIDAGYLAPPNAEGRHYIKAKIPEEMRQAVLKRDGYRCVGCESIKRLSVDHIIPERWGGATTMENLQVLCRPCNSEKKDRMPGGDDE